MDTKWFYEEKLRLDSEGHSHSGVSKRDESDREWKETLESGLKGQLKAIPMWCVIQCVCGESLKMNLMFNKIKKKHLSKFVDWYVRDPQTLYNIVNSFILPPKMLTLLFINK